MKVAIYALTSGAQIAVLQPLASSPAEWQGIGTLLLERRPSLSELAQGRARLPRSGRCGLVLWEREACRG